MERHKTNTWVMKLYDAQLDVNKMKQRFFLYMCRASLIIFIITVFYYFMFSITNTIVHLLVITKIKKNKKNGERRLVTEAL